MLVALKVKFVMALAALASPLALTAVLPDNAGDEPASIAGYADIPPRGFQYRVAGDFSRDGKPAVAPLLQRKLPSHLRIMNRHVTAAEYARCVGEAACPRLARASAHGDRPVVGVSWRDATAYAAWMTRKTDRPRRHRSPRQ